MYDRSIFIKTRRIYVESPIVLAQPITISKPELLHYLKNVLKLREGQYIRAFNSDCEYLCSARLERRHATLTPIELLRQSESEGKNEDMYKARVSVAAAILKGSAMHTLIANISQFNLHAIYPLITERTQVQELNLRKCCDIATNSLEQSEQLKPCVITHPQTLQHLLNNLSGKQLVCCDEKFFYGDYNSGHKHNVLSLSANIQTNVQEFVILIGPEGGFTDQESLLLQSYNPLYLHFKTILKSETAAVASLSILHYLLEYRAES